MPLKAGTVASFSGSLAEAMDNAMKQELELLKGLPLSAQGDEYRHLLFAAIAQGIFIYLKANEGLLMTRITIREDTSLGADENYLVTQLELNL